MKREIKKIDIKLTDKCNLNCIMCGQRVRKDGKQNGVYIDKNHLKKFFSKMPEDLEVYLWGGEPLLHPDFEEIVSFFLSKKAKVSINTNAFFLNKHLDFLSEKPIKSLIVSIDGLDDMHDYIRRTDGLFWKIKNSTLKYIEKSRKFGRKNVVINFTILKENYLKMEEFCDEVKSWDVHSVTMNFLILVDEERGKKFEDEVLEKYNKKITSWRGYVKEYKNKFDYEKFEHICNEIINKHGFFIRWSNENFILDKDNLKKYYEMPHEILQSLTPLMYELINKPCVKIEESVAIEANGNIVICPDFPDTIIGSIREDKFSDFYNKKKYEIYGLDKEYKAICYRCAHRS